MDKTSALKEFDTSRDSDDISRCIEKLYKDGYVIVSPGEMKKIEGMTIFADVHRMNPFAK